MKIQYPNDYKVCATCKHWQGSREFFGNMVREIEECSTGQCGKTHAIMQEISIVLIGKRNNKYI